MYAAKTAAAAAANFHHSPTSTDGSSQGSDLFVVHCFIEVIIVGLLFFETDHFMSKIITCQVVCPCY